MGADDLMTDLMKTMNEYSTSTKAYLQGDHAQHTWGILIPRVVQWLIGGSNIWPLQRYLGVSGEEKSYKSTLINEMGNWFAQQGGKFFHLDSENKTSPDMLDALSHWWEPGYPRSSVGYKAVDSIQEWQTMVQRVITGVRKRGPSPKGERVPVFVSIDSLMGRATKDADQTLRKEGFAAERGFPVGAAAVTNFLEGLNLLGTTCSVGWVQHMKATMEQTGYGTQYKEKGAKAAQFSCSIHLRVMKGSSFRVAHYDGAPFDGYATEGHEIWIRTARSCIGPGERAIMVPLCWQHPEVNENGEVDEDGYPRQAMWFDWSASLATLLCSMKYSDKFKPKLFKEDKDRLARALEFTEVKKNCINCKTLGLEKASYNAFGKAIEENEEVRGRLTRFLGITQFPTVQEADIDFSAGDEEKKKKK